MCCIAVALAAAHFPHSWLNGSSYLTLVALLLCAEVNLLGLRFSALLCFNVATMSLASWLKLVAGFLVSHTLPSRPSPHGRTGLGVSSRHDVALLEQPPDEAGLGLAIGGGDSSRARDQDKLPLPPRRSRLAVRRFSRQGYSPGNGTGGRLC